MLSSCVTRSGMASVDAMVSRWNAGTKNSMQNILWLQVYLYNHSYHDSTHEADGGRFKTQSGPINHRRGQPYSGDSRPTFLRAHFAVGDSAPPPPPPGRCLPEISDRSCSVSSACRANVARNNCPTHASHELQLPLGMGRCTQWYCIGQVLGPRILPGFVEARRSTAEDAVSQPPGSGMVLGFTSIRRNTTQGARQLCMRMSRMVGVHNDGNPDRPNSPQETMVSVSGGASLRTPMHALRC